jgi:hypothetical protein
MSTTSFCPQVSLDSKFMVRAAVIDGQIAQWFSPSTYVAWREAHKFISWRGIPKEASESITAKRKPALSTLSLQN